MISWFDIMFFIMVIACEVHWYRQAKREAAEFEQFKKDMNNQLFEVNQRLEIALEKDSVIGHA